MSNTVSLTDVYGDPYESGSSERIGIEEGGVEFQSEADDPFEQTQGSYEILDSATSGAPKVLFDETGAPVTVKKSAIIPQRSALVVKKNPTATKLTAGLKPVPPVMPFVKPIQGQIGVPPFTLGQQFDSEIMLYFNTRMREICPYWTIEATAIPVANVAMVTLNLASFQTDVAFTEALIALLDIKIGVSMIQSLPDLVVPVAVTGILSGGDAYTLNMTYRYDARLGARFMLVPHRIIRDKVHPSMASVSGAGTLVIVVSNIPDDSQLVVRIAGTQEEEWLKFLNGIKKGRI